jgi:5-methylcytosine-specific restriction endonuclease McrA
VSGYSRRLRSSRRWQLLRGLARQRDGHRCRRCGSSVGLEVHHVWAIDRGGAPFDLDNLITLCRLCHHGAHRKQRIVTPRRAFWRQVLR